MAGMEAPGGREQKRRRRRTVVRKRGDGERETLRKGRKEPGGSEPQTGRRADRCPRKDEGCRCPGGGEGYRERQSRDRGPQSPQPLGALVAP